MKLLFTYGLLSNRCLPELRFLLLQRELNLYEPDLLTRPSLIVATQADRLSPDKLKEAVSMLTGSSNALSVHVVSGLHQWGIRELHLALHAVCPPHQAQAV